MHIEDESIVTNEKGGSQSHIDGDWTQLPYRSLKALATVMDHGAQKYGVRNYRKISVDDHINHALRHLVLYCDKRDEQDLMHAFCRIALALDTDYHDETPRS